MALPPNAAYYARPEHERCQVKGPQCLSSPQVRIYCKTEQTSIQACQPCWLGWRTQAQMAHLNDRCPRCASLPLNSFVPSLPRGPASIHPPLTGVAAQAIDMAMHAEGLTVDVRQKVLIRLYYQAFWLSYVHPETEGMVEHS